MTATLLLVLALSVVIGGLVTVVPVAAGLLVYLDPLRRRGKGGASTGEQRENKPLRDCQTGNNTKFVRSRDPTNCF